jgi:hypothetical protein
MLSTPFKITAPQPICCRNMADPQTGAYRPGSLPMSSFCSFESTARLCKVLKIIIKIENLTGRPKFDQLLTGGQVIDRI